MEVVLGYNLLFEIPIDQIDCQKQALYLKLELEVHLNYPVNQNAPHSLCYVGLLLHVLDFRLVVDLSFEVVTQDFLSKFDYVLGIVCVLEITLFYYVLHMGSYSRLKHTSDIPACIVKLLLGVEF